MCLSIKQFYPHDSEWQELCQARSSSVTLATLVLAAWRMGLWIARAVVEQELLERGQLPTKWAHCSVCGTSLVSKGFTKRRMLTLVGWVEWKRRVGRCPHRCLGSQQIPMDDALKIHAYQQTSTELKRLGCLLAVCLPFGLAAQLLLQFTGILVSDDTLWNWVQDAGQQAMENLQSQLRQLADGQSPQGEPIDPALAALPLLIAADGVTVPFRQQAKSPKGKIVWKEVKLALLARLGKQQTKAGKVVMRLQLEALKQGITTAAQVVWISDGARGFWRLYRECFAHCAVGILDFYHAAQHLWQAATAYRDGNPARTPQQWFARMCHRLRHGFGKGIIKELDWLSKSKNTAEATKPILRQVRDYLKSHLEHIQYRTFKQQNLPIGSGMVESTCKWLIQQRFKGTGMRWSEDGFNHLLHLRLAWVNGQFDLLFADESLTLKLYSPNR